MVRIELKDWRKWQGQGQTLGVFTFEEQAPAAAKEDGFKGKELETFLYRPKDANPAERVLVIGLGKQADFSNEVLRRAAAKVLRGAESLDLKSIALRAPQIAGSPA